ncbi:MAG: CBASS cGAMP synthase [Methyloligella sp. ZOD6]
MTDVASLFYDDNVEKSTLHRRITPNSEQFEEQQERWNTLADYLVDDLKERSGYAISTWLQGSYKLGTQVRGARKGDEFDIDLGVYYRWSGDAQDDDFGPKYLKELVQRSLNSFSSDDVLEVVTPPKMRCCRVRFEGDFHIDVPTYHLNPDQDTRELATQADEWEASDPKAMYLWFKEKFAERERAKVRRQIRYLKIWAALKFEEVESRPSSTLLTVLVAEACDSLDLSRGDDEILADILTELARRLADDREVPNPTDKTEDLSARLQDSDYDAFISATEDFQALAEKALAIDDAVSASCAWSEAFEHFFPMPEPEPVLETKGVNLPVARATPRITIEAVSRDNRNLHWSGVNEIGPIPRNCEIRFRIINADILPPYSEVEWMVRNEGEEAEGTNDLGHRAGMGLTAVEQSAYKGTHYMDCVVKQHGNIVGIQRALVVVFGAYAPKRNPKRPGYVKLRGRR